MQPLPVLEHSGICDNRSPCGAGEAVTAYACCMDTSTDKRAKIIAKQAEREEAANKASGTEREAPRANWAASAPQPGVFKARKPRQ